MLHAGYFFFLFTDRLTVCRHLPWIGSVFLSTSRGFLCGSASNSQARGVEREQLNDSRNSGWLAVERNGQNETGGCAAGFVAVGYGWVPGIQLAAP